ncbi:MAG: Uncharacterised protein [Flavobacteriia bacterium]|nr:MAG: Uncharacterised protein [Flavobacteriia bacterium]
MLCLCIFLFQRVDHSRGHLWRWNEGSGWYIEEVGDIVECLGQYRKDAVFFVSVRSSDPSGHFPLEHATDFIDALQMVQGMKDDL